MNSMAKGFSWASQATVMAGEADAARRILGQGAVRAGTGEEAHQTGDAAGEEHGPHDDPGTFMPA